ncbi:hypothetical protein M3Y94_01249000 [Aphelenchoides besseyi]|nr:hypothetical protein M3Y94_01249000 [Aphelenchoides besseyi]KAI6219390.1 hypothetical protein M3Y95_01106100 [Aphelenchoides besseyi]
MHQRDHDGTSSQLRGSYTQCSRRFLLTFILLVLLYNVRGYEVKTNETEGPSSDAKIVDLRRSNSLESLLSASNPTIHENGIQFALQFEVEDRDFYRSWANELKMQSPIGHVFDLDGGHCLYSTNASEHNFYTEVDLVLSKLNVIRDTFQSLNIPIHSINYSLLLVLNKEAAVDWNKDVFWNRKISNTSRTERSNQTAMIINESNGVQLNLKLHLITDIENVIKKTDLPIGRSNYTVAIREMYKLPDSGFYERVFPANRKLVYRTIYSPLYLEEFINKTNIIPEESLEKLTCNLLIFPFASNSSNEMNAKYTKSVVNLKIAAPNLSHVDLMGGHAVIRERGTTSDLFDELQMLKWSLNALVDAFNVANLTLHSVMIQIFLVFPEQTYTELNYTKTVTELFANDTIVNSTSLNNIFIYRQIDYVDICLELSATSDIETVKQLTNLTEGYSADFTGSSQISGFNMSLAAGDIRLSDW